MEDKNILEVNKTYLDEEWHTEIVHGMEIMLPYRKISTYINALINANYFSL